MYRILEDRVLILPQQAATTTPSGFILLPETLKAMAAHDRGHVVMAGPGRTTDEGVVAMSVVVGDLVIFDAKQAKKITVDGADHYIARETDIFGVLA